MQPDISFIVPAYNVAAYLDDCIDSIAAVPLAKEIIVVDDGSNDATLQRAQERFRRYGEVSVLQQHNCGVSAARNRGMALARGRYIQFVDADDMLLNPQLYPELVRLADRQNLDVVRTVFCRILENGFPVGCYLPYVYRYGKASGMLCTAEDYYRAMLSDLFPSSWNGFYRRSLLEEYGIRFPEGISHSEDAWFMTELLGSRPGLRLFDTRLPCYAYRYRLSSASSYREGSSDTRAIISNCKVAHMLLQRGPQRWQQAHREGRDTAEYTDFCQTWHELASHAAIILLIRIYEEYKQLSEEGKAAVRPYYSQHILDLIRPCSKIPIEL